MQEAMQKNTQKNTQSNTKQHIDWAVLGCGHIAKTFMASIAYVENANVVACAASNLHRAKEFADTHKVEDFYGSYAEMLTNTSAQVVYIATTHNFHFEHIMLCLKHGKHVLCEKPITLNAAQAKAAFSYAKQHLLLLIEAVWTRFLPAITALKKVIQSGVIGKVQCVQSNFSLNRELPDSHRLKNKALAGGALLDLGIYPITLADIVFAKAPTYINSHHLKTNTGVDQNSYYTLQYDDGAIAQLSCGFRLSGPIYANIMGDKGQIHVPFFLGAKEFTITLEGHEPELRPYPFDDSENFSFEIAHMSDCLINGKTNSELMPAEATLRVMNIMDSIRQQWGLTYENESSEYHI